MNSDPVSGAAMIALQLSVGVTHVFALPGADDVIAAALREEGVSVTAARTGAGAMAMASVYARVTGGLGVVLAGRPPQGFDALAGMAVALADRVPLLVLTESAAVAGLSDPGWMQEVFGRMSRLHLRPDTADEIGPMLRILLSASREFPPGPVHLGLRSGVLTATTSLVDPGSPGATRVEESPPESGVRYVLEALRSAGFPLLLAGDGLSRSEAEQLLQLADAHDLLVVGTPEAKAHLDERRIRVLGPIGTWGRAAANRALLDAGVVVAFGGLRSLDAAWIEAVPRLISVGPAVGDGSSPGVPIRADLAAVLTAALRPASGIRGRGETRAHLLRMFSRDEASLETSPGVVHPVEVIRAVGSHVDHATTLVADAGPIGRWVLRYLTSRGDNCLVMGTAATAPSHAVAGGVGAWLARRDRHGAGEWVIVTTDSNGFVDFATEVSTAVDEAAAITWVVFTEAEEGDRPSAGTHPVDHVLLAEALGADGRRVTSVAELDEALTLARAQNAPWVVEVVVDADAAPQRYEPPARLPEAGSAERS